MRVNDGLRIAAAQLFEQSDKRTPLRRCAGIGRTHLSVASTYIADAYRTGIVSAAVRSDSRLGTSSPDRSVESYKIVITNR